MTAFATLLGYLMIFVVAGYVLYIHWLMLVCLLNEMILIRHFGNSIIPARIQSRFFPKTYFFVRGLFHLWRQPFNCERYSGEFNGSHYSCIPGIWPNVSVNGIKL